MAVHSETQPDNTPRLASHPVPEEGGAVRFVVRRRYVATWIGRRRYERQGIGLRRTKSGDYLRRLLPGELDLLREAAVNQPGAPPGMEKYTWIWRDTGRLTPRESWIIGLLPPDHIYCDHALPFPAPGCTVCGWYQRFGVVLYRLLGPVEEIDFEKGRIVPPWV
jgi:hypothetical protein